MLVYTGCRMGFYEWIRDNILGKNPDGTYSFWYISYLYQILFSKCLVQQNSQSFSIYIMAQNTMLVVFLT